VCLSSHRARRHRSVTAYSPGWVISQVSAGKNATFNRSYVGHAGYQNLAGELSETFVGVSGLQPSYTLGGIGKMITTAGDIFTSGGGELRLYMPNRPNNEIAVGTRLNGFIYSDPTSPILQLRELRFLSPRTTPGEDEYITATGYFDHEISYASP